MLNTKYFLIPGADQPFPFRGALGAAWFVDDVVWASSAEEEIEGAGPESRDDCGRARGIPGRLGDRLQVVGSLGHIDEVPS